MALRQHVELLILRQELHLHGPRFYAQTKSPKEGGSSLHTFPPHRPLKRFSFRRQNPKISAPVGKVGLAHAIGNKAEAAYRRGDLFEKRRKLMEAWASYCVVPEGA